MELITVRSDGEIPSYEELLALEPVKVDADLFVLDPATYRQRLHAGLRVTPVRRPAPVGRRVHLELTNACNNRCAMCPRRTMARKVEHMAFDVFERRVAELCLEGVAGVWLYYLGEPLIHPELPRMLEHLRGLPLGDLWLSTNCVALDEERCRLLLRSPVKFLNLSINASRAEEYKRWVPGAHWYAAVEANVERLIALKGNARRPFLRAQMIHSPEHDAKAFIKKYAGRVDMISINYLDTAKPVRIIYSNGEIEDSAKEDEKC